MDLFSWCCIDFVSSCFSFFPLLDLRRDIHGFGDGRRLTFECKSLKSAVSFAAACHFPPVSRYLFAREDHIDAMPGGAVLESFRGRLDATLRMSNRLWLGNSRCTLNFEIPTCQPSLSSCLLCVVIDQRMSLHLYNGLLYLFLKWSSFFFFVTNITHKPYPHLINSFPSIWGLENQPWGHFPGNCDYLARLLQMHQGTSLLVHPMVWVNTRELLRLWLLSFPFG